MRNSHAAMSLLTTALLTVAPTFAQSSDRLPVTDAEKIADGLEAVPHSSPKTRLASTRAPVNALNQAAIFHHDDHELIV